MRKICTISVCFFMIASLLCGCFLGEPQAPAQENETADTAETTETAAADEPFEPAERNLEFAKADEYTPVFCQFFDWFEEETWNESEFSDPFLWDQVGITTDDRSSQDFYQKQFAYMKDLGIDALAWEFHTRLGREPTYPKEEAIAALQETGMKIAPFFDVEITIKAMTQTPEEMKSTLSVSGMLRPDMDTVDFMLESLEDFYANVPADLLAEDAKGRKVIFFYGYDFDDSNPVADVYQEFGEALIEGIHALYGNEQSDPAIYWTAKNSVFQEYLFQHFTDSVIPFQFVLDTPQSQYGHDSVTWNFGYDNYGAAERDGLPRVIRNDKQYIEEMGWLAGASDPALVFIYSWNEPFEGSALIPTEKWGDTKARLCKEMIRRLREDENEVLPKTLLITDDLSDGYRKDDWTLGIEEEMLLYEMRRYVPQADVYMAEDVTEDLLSQYDYIVDISVYKNAAAADALQKAFEDKRIMVFDPKCGYSDVNVASHFGDVGKQISWNGDAAYLEYGEPDKGIFIRDDLNDIVLNSMSVCKSVFIRLNEKIYPAVVSNGDDIFVNSYSGNPDLLRTAFERFYGFEMSTSILYGEGLASQRLEIATNGGITKNTLEEYSINGRWEMPEDIEWRCEVDGGVDESYYAFIFGE